MRYTRMRRFFARHRRTSGGKGHRRLALILLVLLGFWLGFSEWGLSSVSEELTEEAVRSYVLSCVNRAVEEELKNVENSFVSVSRSEDGSIAAVSADTAALNRLKTGVLSRLSKSLKGKASAHVPIGSLTGAAVLNGRGPNVPVRLNLEGCADVAFETEFVSAGVNQSCHRVTMRVMVTACSQSKRFQTRVNTETVTVLAETVVVGRVPQIALTGEES